MEIQNEGKKTHKKKKKRQFKEQIILKKFIVKLKEKFLTFKFLNCIKLPKRVKVHH